MPLILPFPDIDPAVFTIRAFGLEFALRWYALAYVAGLLLGWRYVAALLRRPALWGGTPPMRPEQSDDLLTWMILGVILGGRLGYVLFYQPAYFAANPGEILAVWQGGMSFHGGLIGVATGVVGFALKNGLPILGVGDAVAAAAPIGLFFGRIANFINGELWGRPSTAPWAVVFPGEAAQTCPPGWSGPCARHPSQLYEAGLEGLALFLVLVLAIRAGALARRGQVFGMLLIGYALARIAVEAVRQPDPQFVTATNPYGHALRLGGEWGLTMGQLLSLPMLLVGLVLLLQGAGGMTPLAALIRERIAATGPMRLDAYMGLCLAHPEHGYYRTRDPFGAAGDFVTAPEISQMFGELVGAWAAQVWHDAGRPARFVLAELGPGRGTLMQDALRAAARVPGFTEAAELWLVETSPVLRARQAEALAAHRPRWADRIEGLPAGPLIAIANEFFDALPIRQAQRADALWRERLVEVRGAGLAFAWGPPRPDPDFGVRFPQLPDGKVAEINHAGEAVAAALGARIAREGIAALVVDYGAWDGAGDTLQALQGGRPADPLAAPGLADLTAHVRFRALAVAARPARAHGPLPQGVFLERLGITARAEALARAGGGAARDAIAAAHRRLTHPEEMGNLFQVLALTPEDGRPPGFD